MNGQTAWAVGINETIIKTVDGGANWQIQQTSEPMAGPHVNGVCALSNTHAWAAIDNDVMSCTTDGGVTWTSMKIPATVGDGYHLICVSALNMNTLWVTGVSFVGQPPLGEILHTNNGGETWEKQTMPCDSMLRRISFVGSPK